MLATKKYVEYIILFFQDVANYDLEQVFRAVLYAEERDRHLALIETDHFLVSCSKKYWKASEKLGFKEGEESLKVFPYVLTFKLSLKEDVNLIPNQDKDAVIISIPEASHLRNRPPSQNEASRKNSGAVGGRTQQNKQVGTKSHVSEQKSRVDSVAVSTKTSRDAGKTSAIDVNQLVRSPEGWLRSSKNNVIQTRKMTSKSNTSNKSNTLTTNPVRRSLLGQTNARRNQRSGLESEVATVNKIPNVSRRKKTNVYSVTKIPVSDSLKSKLKKANSVSPVKLSVRQTRIQNRNYNSSSETNDIAPKRVTRAPRLDRHLIESEEQTENLKLQSLASSKSLKRSPRKRRSSGLWEFVEAIATPIKRLFNGN